MEGEQTFIKNTIKVGNGSGVLLPKSLLGAQVRITVLRTKLNIKKETIKIISPIMQRVLGIYLLESNDLFSKVLVISDGLRKSIKKERFTIDIVPLKLLQKSIETKQSIVEKLKNSQAILNQKLLSDLLK